ncbi:nucleotidyltransferase family protein [Variovorax sp. VNK109]|uniref:nucleotidyltransferase family protein n=1 Tax=Variovorax sp. VNK109 TaxID=3400919 RepID=UPI003C112C90
MNSPESDLAPGQASTAPHDLPVVIVLASGRGERFMASGAKVHKLQALLAGTPVLQLTLEAVRSSGLPWHLEDAGHPGMGESIAAAVRATRDAPGWLVLPADLPLVNAESLRRVADALAGSGGVVVPFFEGTRGHPVGFAASCGDALAALTGDRGAQQILRAHEAAGLVTRMDLTDEGIVTDIDTLEDLARAEALLVRRRR